MAKEICISTTPHETRLAIIEDEQLAEIYYERENEYTLAGSVYKGRVTRVLPGMQSSFVDVGLERDAFLYVTDFLEDSEDADEYETSTPNGGGRRTAERNGEHSPERSVERSPERQVSEKANAEENTGDERRPRRGENRRGEKTRDERPAAEAQPRARAADERAAATAALRTAQPTETDRDEKGDEGDAEAPQGTRRWRGRRGRRRGGVRAGVLGVTPAGETSEDLEIDAQPATAPFDLPEHGAPGGLAAPLYVAMDEENEPEAVDLQAAAAVPQHEAAQTRGRNRTPAKTDRAVRGRVTNTEGRPPRETREPTAPASALLPGESISKYGGAAETASTPAAKLSLPARPVNYTAPKPSTQVEVALASWDGGSVLPGESLSRYKGPSLAAPSADLGALASGISAAPAEAPEQISGTHIEAALEAAPERLLFVEDQTTDQATSNEIDAALQFAAAVPPETVAEALPGVEHGERITTTAEPIEADQQTAEAVKESEGSEPEGNESMGSEPLPAELDAVAPVEGESDEYEPVDGEASVRLSAPTTSELRFSQLFGLGESHGAVAAEEKAAVPEHSPELQAATPADEPQVSAAQAEEPVRSTLDAGSEVRHEIPGVSESTPNQAQTVLLGEFLSVESSTYEAPHQKTPEAENEIIGQDESLSLHARGAVHGEDNFTELVDQLQGFSPGSGLLEEEVMDEDEYDFDPIHAHADEHDLEDLEEETLDGEDHGATSEPHDEGLTLRMEDSGANAGVRVEDDDQDEDEARVAFALEEVGDEDDEGEPALASEGGPQRSDRNGERPGDDRARRGGRNGGRRRGPGGNGGRRQSAQTQDLPIISDLLKQGQEILVQIAKEPIAKKGARITSHIALPGRFLVFMPTVHHVGVSRKIASDEERQRLKRILISERGENSGGFIVRTAAEGATEEELRADLRFLISLWTEIKQRADTAKAPALIYHDLNLVERILRDQVSSNFSTIWVDTEQEYERIVRFLNRFQPSLVRRVKLYTKETPLFEHFGIQEEISKALKSKVWLKSGGSIVINQTEALVAIDINTGKYVGKTARLEDTIVKTNLDAIPEIVRQIRLRDLGGIIVIDFIDMDERKNRNRVLAALEEAMKVDRAPSKVLQFNDFGLVAITRKRVKQSLERTLSVQCETCAGTGMVKSPITVCNEIYIELRKMQKHLDGKDVMLRVNPEVVKQLKSSNGRWINEYEEMVGKTIIIKSDPSLHPEQFDIH